MYTTNRFRLVTAFAAMGFYAATIAACSGGGGVHRQGQGGDNSGGSETSTGPSLSGPGPATSGAGGSGDGAGGSGGCAATGDSCASQPCCQDDPHATNGATCISQDELCHANCAGNSDCASGCCAPVQNQSYGVCADASYCATGGGVGDACSSNGDCASGVCDGWCTEPCSANNNVCAGGHGNDGLENEYGQLNWCVETSQSSDICFPGCDTDADCAPYPGTSCQSVTSVADGTVTVCAAN